MRWTIAVFALVLAVLQLQYWFGDDRRPGRIALEQAVSRQAAVNQTLAERNADLRAELANLRQGTEAAEERARSELGLIRPDEDFFQFVEIDGRAEDRRGSGR